MQARSISYINQLYTLAKAGQITWKLYNSLKNASTTKQKEAVKKYSKGVGTTRRRQETVKLKKQVKDIQHRLNNDMAKHTNRRIDSGVMLSSDNLQQVYDQQMGFAISYIEAAVAGLRYYNPAVPGTLTTADASTGTFSRQLTMTNVHCEFEFRNNYQVPVNMVIYECSVKEDTSIAPSTTMTNGLTDQYATYPGNTGLYIYPTDSNQFKELWSIKKTLKVRLEPGKKYKYTHNSGKFTYDPSLVDSHALVYQKEHKAKILLIRIFGDIAHDSANGEYGVMGTGVDWIRCITTNIEYDAGTSLNDYSVDNNLDAFTNGPLLSNKPVSDNQTFSIT